MDSCFSLANFHLRVLFNQLLEPLFTATSRSASDAQTDYSHTMRLAKWWQPNISSLTVQTCVRIPDTVKKWRDEKSKCESARSTSNLAIDSDWLIFAFRRISAHFPDMLLAEQAFSQWSKHHQQIISWLVDFCRWFRGSGDGYFLGKPVVPKILE